MSQIAKSRVAVLLSGLFAAVVPGLALASPPDAGTILDSVRTKDYIPPKKSAPGLDIQQEAQPAMRPENGFKTKVSAFHITGNTLFGEAELKQVIAASVGKELSLADLEKVASEISNFYRGRGYFVARAYLPAQEIKGGVVEIAVLEGRIGNVSVNLKGDGHIPQSVVQKTVSASAKPGDVINEVQLERGLLLANDLSGIRVDSTLVPGAAVGTSDLVVDATETRALNGSVDFDISGNKFTGASRVGAAISYSNPIKLGDQIALRVMTSGSGMQYSRLSYLLPVGYNGTKVGAAYSYMSYKLGGTFASSGSAGTAGVASLNVIHPVIRSRNKNLYAQLGFDSKQIIDNTGNGSVPKDNKKDNTFTASVFGDTRDGFGSGGMNTYSFAYVTGNLDLAGVAADLVNDSTTIQSNGSFSKSNFSLSRLQRLNDKLSLYASVNGQSASKNLDSAEKISLGGPGGVRGYPSGEASGDEGQLLTVELRRELGSSSFGNFQLVGFYDAGRIELNKKTWSTSTGAWYGTNPGLSNTYSLSGAGVGINLSNPGNGKNVGGYSVKAFLAGKLGSNPGASATGMDSDGTNSSTRFWLEANKWF